MQLSTLLNNIMNSQDIALPPTLNTNHLSFSASALCVIPTASGEQMGDISICIQSIALSEISGTHWEFWNVSPCRYWWGAPEASVPYFSSVIKVWSYFSSDTCRPQELLSPSSSLSDWQTPLLPGEVQPGEIFFVSSLLSQVADTPPLCSVDALAWHLWLTIQRA